MAAHHSAYSALTNAIEQDRPVSVIPLPRTHEASVFVLCDVYAELANEQQGGVTFMCGVLTVVEKAHGVYVEWKPCEADEGDQDWTVIATGDDGGGTGGGASSPPHPRRNNACHVFSADIKEIRSFAHNDSKKGTNWLKFICKDGTASNVLHLRGGGFSAFVGALQRYALLNRSAKEPNLVLLVDNRTDALEKSVGMLMHHNKDIVSRFISNPYATSLTALSKVTSIMAPLLDPEAVLSEHQLRAMSRSMDLSDERIRSHNEAGFEHVFQLDLPNRPKIPHRDQPVDSAVWEKFRAPDGRVTDSHTLKSLIFRGGVHPSLRPTLWKYLLGYYKWDQSDEQNKQVESFDWEMFVDPSLHHPAPSQCKAQQQSSPFSCRDRILDLNRPLGRVEL